TPLYRKQPAWKRPPSPKPGMRSLSAPLRQRCAGPPHLPEQAVEDPITKAVMQPTRSAKHAFLGKAQSFRDRAAAGIVRRTGDLDFLHLPFLERMLDHGPAR